MATQGKGTLAVVWPRFGPYHLVRLEAASVRLASEGWKVLGVEVARTDREYAWAVVKGARQFERVTLWQNRDYQDLRYDELRREMARLLDDRQPDVIAINGWRLDEARAAFRWALRNQRRIIVMSASTAMDARRVFWREWIKRRLIRRCHAALAGGSPQRRYLEQLGMCPEQIEVGYDVVDNDYFATRTRSVRADRAHISKERGWPERSFLTCCRFLDVKNLFRLLDAYCLYRKAMAQPWGLVICGDGPLMPALRRYEMEHHIQGVVWPGFLQQEELPLVYGTADAFILPSLKDTWGLVVNEAMASGLPVIVSRRCGCAEDLVQEGRNGYVIEPKDVAGLACRMMEFSSDLVRCAAMGQESRRIISEWAPPRFADGMARCVQAAGRLPVKHGNALDGLVARMIL